MKIDPKGILITTYGKENGIDPGAITPLSSYKSRDGQHFFGDSTGFYTFHPRDIKPNIHPPQITFSDFKIFDKTIIPGSDGPLYAPIDQMKKIELAHDQNTFSVDFAGIHFTSPSQNQHFFMLGNY